MYTKSADVLSSTFHENLVSIISSMRKSSDTEHLELENYLSVDLILLFFFSSKNVSLLACMFSFQNSLFEIGTYSIFINIYDIIVS
jgi:hypothetical protein